MKYIKRYNNLYEKYNDKISFYHISTKDNLKSLLKGIKSNLKDEWKQGKGFYVYNSEKVAESQEGVGKNIVDIMIEFKSILNYKNFDMDYELNYNLPRIIKNNIKNIKNKFKNNFIIKYNDKNYLIFTNNLNKENFYFGKILFRNEITYIPKSNKEGDWCYLPVDKNLNIDIEQNIYGVPLIKNFMKRLDRYGIKKMIFEDLSNDNETIAYRYLGPIIYPNKYKIKTGNKWGEWKDNNYLKEDIDWDWVDEEIGETGFKIGDKVVTKGYVQYYNTYDDIFDLSYIKEIDINRGGGKTFIIIDTMNYNGVQLIKLEGHWPWFISDGFRKYENKYL
jgi:hypothetical protein